MTTMRRRIPMIMSSRRKERSKASLGQISKCREGGTERSFVARARCPFLPQTNIAPPDVKRGK